ncbi:MAG: hypothetical protein HQL05_03990 [Nitrospirae bacterium]|uniref:hypothetical protein n=1 Tax=Candidatus Magnetobacterium casense TaxID=1455061 RepID=UPI0012DEDC59|nr:hypothetical protein [Candidatus Magnetobacterium casensis]MBF0336970.1 hypothetical protein [Nitrospirota bacterium]
MKHLRLPLIVSLTLLSLYACAWLPKLKGTTTVDHSPKDITLNELLKRLYNVTRISGIVELNLKTSKQTLSGNASIVLDDSGFQINVYSLGFLVGEFTQKDGHLSSSPEMDDADKEIFAKVIREGLMWWKFNDLITSDIDNWLILKTYGRIVVLDKAALAPVKQSLYIGDDSIMRIVYKDTVWTDGIAYPSRIDASLGENSLNIKVEAIRFE